jgi:hypothetical protein
MLRSINALQAREPIMMMNNDTRRRRQTNGRGSKLNVKRDENWNSRGRRRWHGALDVKWVPRRRMQILCSHRTMQQSFAIPANHDLPLRRIRLCDSQLTYKTSNVLRKHNSRVTLLTVVSCVPEDFVGPRNGN